jgi:hypothetical protein
VSTSNDRNGRDAGNPFEVPDEELRGRALLALRQGRFDLAEKLLAGKDVDQAAWSKACASTKPSWRSRTRSFSAAIIKHRAP